VLGRDELTALPPPVALLVGDARWTLTRVDASHAWRRSANFDLADDDPTVAAAVSAIKRMGCCCCWLLLVANSGERRVSNNWSTSSASLNEPPSLDDIFGSFATQSPLRRLLAATNVDVVFCCCCTCVVAVVVVVVVVFCKVQEEEAVAVLESTELRKNWRISRCFFSALSGERDASNCFVPRDGFRLSGDVGEDLDAPATVN